MRSRAALLPYPGDPFLLNYWLHFFDTVWQSEVDHLYIFLNSPVEKAVVEYIQFMVNFRNATNGGKITLLYEPYQFEHGDVVNRMLDECKEELVMLVEDDGFIFKPGLVDAAFAALESGEFDIVGSKRGSCSMEILTRAKQLWGLDYSGEGDQGCNFWPNFFFTRKQLLIETDRNFAARTWQKGDVIEALSTPSETYYAQDMAVGDTFVNTSLQLQKRIPQNRIKYVPQYHGSPDDMEHFERNYNLFDGRAGWCHIGSLSSGIGGILQDGMGRCLARRMIDPIKEDGKLPIYAHTDQEKMEFERRVQWWQRFLEFFLQNHTSADEPVMDFALAYQGAIERLIDEYGLSRSRIDRRKRIYATLGL